MRVWNRKKTPLQRMLHKPALYYLILFLSVLMLSCNSRPENILDRDAMTAFLTDLHRLDGALASKGFGTIDQRENIYYYNALLKKHAITKAEFDSSLSWYAKNPKKFERIYVSVIENLTTLEQQVKNGYFHPVDSVKLRNSEQKLWPDSMQKFTFTDKVKPALIRQTIKNQPLSALDLYVLSFRYKVNNSNKAANQLASIRISYENKVSDSLICKLHNSNLLCRYTLRLKADKMLQIDSVTATVYGAKSLKQYVSIDSIQFIRKYDMIAQDSIRQVIQAQKAALLNKNAHPVNYRLRSKILLQLKDETTEQPVNH
jgi:hypothetical protein